MGGTPDIAQGAVLATAVAESKTDIAVGPDAVPDCNGLPRRPDSYGLCSPAEAAAVAGIGLAGDLDYSLDYIEGL